MCGEKTGIPDGFGHRGGSPPRVRGKAPTLSASSVNMGITPACAGKSPCGCTAATRSKDHPRVCGEKNCSSGDHLTPSGSPPRVRGKEKVNYYKVNGSGSPPRVRGKDRLSASASSPLRITPACAGKRKRYAMGDYGGGDHPRVCGEKIRGRALCQRRLGSPPRVRGKGR